MVMFSGGRDSSILLTLATRVARSEGLDLPIPFTHRYADVAEADETDWQDLVIRGLGLGHWERRQVTDEHDFLGELSTELLGRIGLSWPPNLHSHYLSGIKMTGGSLLTGAFGDEIFTQTPRVVRLREVLTLNSPPRMRDFLSMASSLLPSRTRTARWRRRWPPATPSWLTPDAANAVSSLLAEELASSPLGWSAELEYWWRLRATQFLHHSLQSLGRLQGITILAPFGDARFLGALAGHWGFRGPKDRPAAMDELFGDAVDRRVLTRTDKATFNAVFWGTRTRRFVTEWDGRTPLDRFVDADRLRLVWSWTPGEDVDPHQFQAALPLHHTWLHRSRSARK